MFACLCSLARSRAHLFVSFRLDIDNSSVDIDAEDSAEIFPNCLLVWRHLGFLQNDGCIDIPEAIAHVAHPSHSLDEENIG